jgi:hypothetical protein
MIAEQIIPLFERFKIEVGNISLWYPKRGVLDSPQSKEIARQEKKGGTGFTDFIFPGEVRLVIEKNLAS